VTDASGAVISGSECTITNTETNVSTSTTTNEDGIYVIPGPHPATYKLATPDMGAQRAATAQGLTAGIDEGRIASCILRAALISPVNEIH
jgi:hypothetical protein